MNSGLNTQIDIGQLENSFDQAGSSLRAWIDCNFHSNPLAPLVDSTIAHNNLSQSFRLLSELFRHAPPESETPQGDRISAGTKSSQSENLSGEVVPQSFINFVLNLPGVPVYNRQGRTTPTWRDGTALAVFLHAKFHNQGNLEVELHYQQVATALGITHPNRTSGILSNMERERLLDRVKPGKYKLSSHARAHFDQYSQEINEQLQSLARPAAHKTKT